MQMLKVLKLKCPER